MGVSPSELLTSAAKALEINETKKLELKVDKAFKKWKDLEVQAGIAKAEYEGAKSELEFRRKMELDLKLEEDSGAWYLRSLIEDGTIRKIQPKEPSLESIRSILQHLADEYDLPIDLSCKTPRAEKTENGQVSITVRRFLRRKGLTTDRQGYIVINEDAFRPRVEPDNFARLRLDLDMKNFTADLLAGNISEDTPLSALKEYSPSITSAELKEEVKNRMMSFYQTIGV